MRSIPPTGSIPNSVRQRRLGGNSRAMLSSSQYSIKRRTPHYTRMSTGTLEKMLAEALDRNAKLTEVVRANPDNDNLERLSKLDGVIQQLKRQIASRK